jgi:hypothetical protein
MYAFRTRGSTLPVMATTSEVECPGCGRALTVKSDRKITIEWHKFGGDRRYSGSVVVPAIEVYRITVDGGVIESWVLHSSTAEGDRFAGTFHECRQGRGDSHDRAVPGPTPPPRASSIALDRPEST